MAVVGDAEVLVFGQTQECFVALDLVLVVQLHRSLGHDVAVVLDSSDVVVQAVNFLQVDFLNQVLWVFLGRRLKWVLFTVGSFLTLLFQSLLLLWVLDGFVDFVGLASEGKISELVVLVVVLVVERWELLEPHASLSAAPVESLLRELISVGKGEAQGNIVVAILASDLSPEQELFEIIGGRIVEQLLKCEFELESTRK